MEQELSNLRVVAIDGGTATGKGRLITELSSAMRLVGVPVIHLSTGSVYRAVAWSAMQDGLKLDDRADPQQLLSSAREHEVEMHGGIVWVDGAPARENELLKAPAVGMASSAVSVHLPVRQLVTAVARRQINEFDGYVLVDGRDITHTVVPEAPLKFLLTVHPLVAAKRSQEHSLAEIKARDAADHNKPHGALRRPEDPGVGVVVLATDQQTPESLRDEVYRRMRRVFGDLPEAMR